MERALKVLSVLFASIFGYIFVALSLFVAVETLGRKLFNYSLQGADELGGYALAVGSSLAFTVALIERAHIRIEMLHRLLPRLARTLLNWLSIVLIAAFGVLIVWVCATILADTLEYHSTAPTPWATPLIWPQGFWYGGLMIFAVLATILALRATFLLASGRHDDLDRIYGPKEAREEIAEELEDLARR